MLRPVGGRRKVARKLSDSIENIVVLNLIFFYILTILHTAQLSTLLLRRQGNKILVIFLKILIILCKNNEKYDNSGEKLEVGQGCHVFQDP